jgi:hypothetical protein
VAKKQAFGVAGAKLWAAILAVYEFEEPQEEALLGELCRTVDVLAELDAAIDAQGVVVRPSFEKVRPNPLLLERRAQTNTYLRLVKAMGLPMGLADAGGKVRHGVREARLAAVVADGSGVA